VLRFGTPEVAVDARVAVAEREEAGAASRRTSQSLPRDGGLDRQLDDRSGRTRRQCFVESAVGGTGVGTLTNTSAIADSATTIDGKRTGQQGGRRRGVAAGDPVESDWRREARPRVRPPITRRVRALILAKPRNGSAQQHPVREIDVMARNDDVVAECAQQQRRDRPIAMSATSRLARSRQWWRRIVLLAVIITVPSVANTIATNPGNNRCSMLRGVDT